MDKTVLVPVADGTEELEAVAIIDVLRRAGAVVTIASVTGEQRITASRGVVIVADALIDACVEQDFDLVVLPGGIPGAQHLRDCADLVRILKRQPRKKRAVRGDLRQPGGGPGTSWAAGRTPGHLSPGVRRSADRQGSGRRPRGDGRHRRHCLTSRGAGEPPSSLAWRWWNGSTARTGGMTLRDPWRYSFRSQKASSGPGRCSRSVGFLNAALLRLRPPTSLPALARTNIYLL